MLKPTVAIAAIVATVALAWPALAKPAVKTARPPGVALTQDPGAAVRLPHTVTPLTYKISITPDAPSMTFKGAVTIRVRVNRPGSAIVLNAKNLTFSSVRLDGKLPGKATLDKANERARLDFGRVVQPGEHSLTIEYAGKINTFSAGLFALDYNTPKGKERGLFTQFENADARAFVPSWDDPADKAVFQISVTAPSDQMVVNNEPVESSERLSGGLTRTTFRPTPKMSSYLMFLGVGDFERIHEDVDGVDVGVVVRRGATNKAEFALDTAAQILRYYNDYFGYRYPLPKLDLIAGPGVGGFGAMENWGAIFYFEDDLLFDPKLSTQSDRQRVAIVIAHEMAHQWFGDLVTMKWWDDLWLNESFAEWMEAKAVDHLHPDWKAGLSEADSRESAFAIDAMSATHPIIEPKDTVAEMNGIGDAITYEKGAAVIRMLEAYVGPENWRAGVQAYMKEHAYSNTTHDDLYRAMEVAARKPVMQIARDFTQQAGVPLISVDAVKAAPGGVSVTLHQGRFGLDAPSKTPKTWHVPVNLASIANGATAQAVIAGAEPQAVTLGGPEPLVANAGETGYYRTLYAAAIFGHLADNIGRLGDFDQMSLIRDSWALADGAYAPAGEFLTLAQRLPATADPLVWSALADQLARIDALYDGLTARQAVFRTFGRKVLEPELARLGWDARPGESAGAKVARESVLTALSNFDDDAVIAEARKRFAAFQRNPSSLSADIRAPVLRIVGQHATEADFEALRALAKASTDSQEKEQYLESMAAVSDPALSAKMREIALSPEVPASLGPRLVLYTAIRHPDAAYRYSLAHKSQIDAVSDTFSRLMIIPLMLSNASTDALADELHAFAANSFPAGGRATSDKVEAGIRHRAEVRVRVLPEIDVWLNAHARVRESFGAQHQAYTHEAADRRVRADAGGMSSRR